MPHLRLKTRVFTESLIYPATGESVLLPAYRLYLGLHFVRPGTAKSWRPKTHYKQSRRFDAVVDTGASLSNIPYEIWEPFTSEIRWIKTAARNFIRVGGMSIRYRLGRVMLAAFDNKQRWMGPAWTVARFWDYYDDVPPPLLGLSSPFLMNGRMLRHANLDGSDSIPEWWLED